MNKSEKAKLQARKFNPYFIKYLADPFDEHDVAKLYNSSEPCNSLMEISMIWGMRECARMLEANGMKGAIKKFQEVLDNGLVTEDEVDQMLEEAMEDEEVFGESDEDLL